MSVQFASEVLNQIFNTISVGLIVVDRNNQIRLWNDWVEKRSNIEASAAIGQYITAIFDEPPSTAFTLAITKTIDYRLPVILSNALHRSPLPLYERNDKNREKKRIHQSITLTPLEVGGERQCLIQITDSTTSIKREKILRSHSELLKKEATTDSLTGIYNRRFFDEHFKMALAQAVRHGTSLSVFMVDIDFFKQFNDYYGHVAGDKALVQVAGALKSQLLRASDVLARFGGEEFVLMLPNISQESAMQFAEKLQNAIRDLHIPHEKSLASPHISISIGFSHFSKDALLDSAALLKTADAALYAAKNNGRNRIFFLSLPSLTEQSRSLSTPASKH
ncbi:sensor domain-containing diguanylate cyclase [Undibacterium oligocarboniphilum]|uniref:diguanylate cyclase n=1 Tax=Undibacterium oligocarboniphilum TaxID=666702 RepID=A0A850QNM0_9BURK|nr:sensor domain-containing diguanylate cyclase [Undibacterium oligocarboniphilum]MBC3871184.1 GGDEF domain-containing protein [Undibacterium oligocarboniphilum]NVO79275.1 GGDEF domain-containing protein [Undibacterium oligocarboniphilum]